MQTKFKPWGWKPPGQEYARNPRRAGDLAEASLRKAFIPLDLALEDV